MLRLCCFLLSAGALHATAVTDLAAAPSTDATSPATAASITLTWTNSVWADSFNVYRRPAGGSFNYTATLNAGPASSPYVDATVQAGASYEYVVRAVTGAVEAASDSNLAGPALTLPGAPTSLTATGSGTASIGITWDQMAGATSYVVYASSTAVPGSFSALTGTVSTVNGVCSFPDTNGGMGFPPDATRYYEVAAVNATGTGPTTTSVLGTSVPSAPTGLTAIPGLKQITLLWGVSNVATGYSVYKGTTAGSYPVLVATGSISSLLNGSWVDTGLGDGETWHYQVQAYNAAGTSAFSTPDVVATTNGGPYLNGGTITTIAGQDGAPGFSDSGGLQSLFNGPRGLAIPNGSGAVYAADTGNHIIRIISPFDGATTSVGGYPGIAGNSLTSPRGVAINSSAVVYVADTGKNVIRQVVTATLANILAGDSLGQSGRTNGVGSAARFNAPGGLAVDSAGTIYVADTGNNELRKIIGSTVTLFAGSTLGAAGSLNGAGSNARFNQPAAIAVDSGGTLYVADTGNHTIRKVTSAGLVSTLAGLAANSGYADGSGTAARFNSPAGIAVDSSGNVYVADTGNHTIRRITPAGVVTTIAGAAGIPGAATGTGSAARFNGPAGVAVDNTSGIVYLADTTNHVIRKLALGTPSLTSSNTASGSYGQAFAYAAGYATALTGSGATGLPSWLSYDATTGTLAGTPTAVGDFPVTLAASNGTVSGGGTVTITIAQASQTINFGSLADTPYSASPITLSATSSSGLGVTFSVVSGPATVSGSSLTLTGVGVVKVRASQTGNTNYFPAPDVDRTFTVGPSYAYWLKQYFTDPEITAAIVTADNYLNGQDGLPNLTKYALGLDPKVNATTGLPTVSVSAPNWVYTFSAPTGQTDITIIVEACTDLATWGTTNVTLNRTGPVNGLDTYSATYPLASATNVFFRVKVTRP